VVVIENRKTEEQHAMTPTNDVTVTPTPAASEK
jgi:hypothetical protein